MLTFNLTRYFYPSGIMFPQVHWEQAIKKDTSYSITLTFKFYLLINCFKHKSDFNSSQVFDSHVYKHSQIILRMIINKLDNLTSIKEIYFIFSGIKPLWKCNMKHFFPIKCLQQIITFKVMVIYPYLLLCRCYFFLENSGHTHIYRILPCLHIGGNTCQTPNIH